MPPRAADKFVKDVAARDVESLRRALAAMADLEVETAAAAASSARTPRRSARCSSPLAERRAF